MKRLRRSDSSDDGVEELGLVALAQRIGEIAQRTRRAKDAGKRRAQVVRQRRQDGSSQLVGLDAAFDAIGLLDQMHALDGKRGLIDERIQQPALVGRQKRAGLVAVDADDADSAASGTHGQEQALGTW